MDVVILSVLKAFGDAQGMVNTNTFFVLFKKF